MVIGEFCSGAGGHVTLGLSRAAPAYWLYEMAHAAIRPARAFVDVSRLLFENSANPLAESPFGKSLLAAGELFERTTRRFAKPEWNINSTIVDGDVVPVQISCLWERPFCRLLHFRRAVEYSRLTVDPCLLIVAPMSGHYPTLLRGTVQAFLPSHDVYITEWVDARAVPLIEGCFDLDDYIDYVIDMLHLFNGDVHVLAVCQAAVPVLAAVALMDADDHPDIPRSMTLMGGPIDTRINPSVINKLAERRGIDWFRQNVITRVPFPNPGALREVYPGFLQLYGFMVMNLSRHMEEHFKLFQHLIHGDGDSAQRHRDFYDEYLAVADLCAEFYLQTCDTVFIRHALPKGEMTHRSRPVDPAQIRHVALMTIEGEHDDICGVGQTSAALRLCANLPASHKKHWLQLGVGHYGVFNGARFRAEIVPRVRDFILENDHG
ncbi:polyhydroxyalkanoate depolymerase [Acidocella aromatica]|uniref:Poly(3-hydroxybutyrate) depolymerase n=1 Tax=Acidocella aromatica TaxID=1303579 RepID=A0A840VER6_9PROT|nr:polyhydroxyalkanoate depolymerase [Acidocella aromatica]MBB5373377.1 poly(3-hydroxybutyrate) depolymerase [Acidocella aromatica]